MKHLNNLVHWMLPDWYDPTSKRMSYILTLAWGILISFSLQIIYFALFSLSSFTLGTTINVITGTINILSALLLKYTRHTDAAANITIGIIFFNTIATSYFTGGLNSSIIIWLLIIPIVCIFILKRWYGIIWIIGSIAVLTVYYLFFPQGSPDSISLVGSPDFGIFLNISILLVAIWYSAVVIDNNKNRAIEEANAAREEAYQASEEMHQIAQDLELELEHGKMIQTALKDSEERLDLAIRGADMGLWDWNVITNQMTRSEKCAEILGITFLELDITYGEWIDLIHPEDMEQVQIGIKEHLDGYSSLFRSEHRVRKKNGEWIWVLVSGAVTARNDEGDATRMVGVTLDITDKKMYEVQLQHLANTDALTGLINRRHFFELAHTEFKRAARYGLPLSISMIDLDHFKKVNDRHGHLMGDHVLFKLSGLFASQIRDMDILARYGGEEFVILFPHINSQEAWESAERIRKIIEETVFHLDGEDIRLTVSMGIASNVDYPTQDIETLLELADKALYRSKNEGRNRITIWDASDTPCLRPEPRSRVCQG